MVQTMLQVFSGILDVQGKYEHVNMEASLAITGRIDLQHAAIPPIITEAVEVGVRLVSPLTDRPFSCIP